MAATFRTSPMGFNKKDVIDYIEKLVAEKNQNIESAWNEYKSLESRVNKMMTELEIALAEAQDVQTALAEEKDLLEERALGSEQAFADLEASVAEIRSAHAEELEALRAAHAAELENLRASHAEELKAIYAERSAQLDKKNERIRALEADAADHVAEIESLRSCNKRLLAQVEELEQTALTYASTEEVDFDADELPSASPELLNAFKTRFIEITGELSLLAQALLEAEKREGYTTDEDELTFPVDLSEDDLPDGETEEEEPTLLFEEEPEEEEEEADLPYEEAEEEEIAPTRVEVTDYPDPARAPKPVQKKAPSVRDLLDRLRTIGDRLL